MKLKLKKHYVEFNEGDWVEPPNVGDLLTFDELTKMMGKLVVIDYSTCAHPWYKVVRVVEVFNSEKDGSMVFSDGKRLRGRISRMFLELPDTSHSKSYVYKLNPYGTSVGRYHYGGWRI